MNNQTNDKLSKSLLKRHAVQNDLPVTNIYTDNSVVIANMQKTIDEQQALIHELTDLLDKAQYCVVIASDYRYDIAGSDDEKCQEYNQLNVRIYNKLQALAPPSEKG